MCAFFREKDFYIFIRFFIKGFSGFYCFRWYKKFRWFKDGLKVIRGERMLYLGFGDVDCCYVWEEGDIYLFVAGFLEILEEW